MPDITSDTQELAEEVRQRLGNILEQLIDPAYLLYCVRNGLIESRANESDIAGLNASFRLHIIKKAEKNALEKILNDNILSTNIQTRDGMSLEKDLVVKNLQTRIQQLRDELSMEVPRNPTLGVL